MKRAPTLGLLIAWLASLASAQQAPAEAAARKAPPPAVLLLKAKRDSAGQPATSGDSPGRSAEQRRDGDSRHEESIDREHGEAAQHGKAPATAAAAQPDLDGAPSAGDAMRKAAREMRREQQRKRRYDELKVQLRGRGISVAMQAELRNHARRMARLQRVRELANVEDATLLPRIDGLVAKENARHQRRIAALIAVAEQAGSDQDDEVEE